MKLEHQVCSLELAKRLKELGVKQESWFSWNNERADEDGALLPTDWCLGQSSIPRGKDECSAFTVAELGEMLPKRLSQESSNYYGAKSDEENWEVGYVDMKGESVIHCEYAATEADARARMMIYLLENKLIDLPK